MQILKSRPRIFRSKVLKFTFFAAVVSLFFLFIEWDKPKEPLQSIGGITAEIDEAGVVPTSTPASLKSNDQTTNNTNGLIRPVKASWYDYKLDMVGKGVPCKRLQEDCFTEHNLVAASREYPRGTKLKVCKADVADTCVVVTVTDWVENQQVAIDLSSYAFGLLSPLSRGIITVTISKVNN